MGVQLLGHKFVQHLLREQRLLVAKGLPDEDQGDHGLAAGVQPLDTLYTLRLDPGRQTVVTLIFIREAFGYQEPLFPPAMLDEFLLQKLEAHRTK